MVKNGSSDVYGQTNKLLFDALQKGITQERRNIVQLQKAERDLKEKVASEEKNIQHHILPEKKRELGLKLHKYSEELTRSRQEIKSKEELLQHSQETLSTLKQEMKVGHRQEDTLDVRLEERLRQLLNHKSAESKRLRLEKERHDEHIKHIGIEREKLRKKIKVEENNIEPQLKKDKREQEHKVAAVGRVLHHILNLKRNLIRGTIDRSKAIQHTVEKINEERDFVQEHFKKAEEHLARGDFKFSDPIFAKLFQEGRQKLRSYRGQKKQLRSSAEKKEAQIRRSLAAAESYLIKLRQQKEKVGRSSLHIQQRLAKLAIHHIKTIYEQKFQNFQEKKKSIASEITKIESKRTELSREFERNKNSLHSVAGEMQGLEQQLILRQKSDQERIQSLFAEVDLLRKEILMGEAKLKRMDTLISTFKKMSVESPEILSSFKNEQEKIRSRLQQLDKDIIHKQHQAKAIGGFLEVYKNHFMAKKKSIGQIQERLSKEQNRAIQLLAEMNKEAVVLRQGFESTKEKTAQLSHSEQKEIGLQNQLFSRKVEAINDLISSKQEEYRKSLDLQRNTSLILRDLTKKAALASRRMGGTSSLLSQQRDALHKQKLLQQVLEEKLALFQEIKRKIDGELGVVAELKQTEIEQRPSVVHEKANLAEQFAASIRRLGDKFQNNGRNRLESLSKKVSAERKKNLLLHRDAQRREQKISRAIAAQEALLEITRKKAGERINQLRRERLAALKESAQNRFALLSKHLHAEELKKEHLDSLSREKEKFIDQKIVEQKRKFHQEKVGLQEKLKALRSRAASSNDKISAAVVRIKQLDSVINSLSQRIDSARKRKAEIEEKISTHDSHLRLLHSVVKDKLRSLAEVKDLRKEMHQLHLVIDNNLPKCKTKTKIITRIKKVRVKSVAGIKPVLKTIDGLLGKLPAKEIDRFAKSNDFTMYKKIMDKYKIR